LRYPALNLELTALKGAEDTNWLREMDSQALQESLRDLDRSVVNFFEKQARFPKFKKVEYKALWSGKLVSVIGRFFPSGKLHRTCGTIKADLLSDREWICEGCGASIDRDKNAAENILAEGLNLVAAGQADTQNAHGASVRLAKREQLVLK
jgi:transposase